MGLLDALIYGLRDVFDSDDNQLPRRSRVKFDGTVTDDPENDRLIVETGGGSGSSPGSPEKSLQTKNGGAFKGLKDFTQEGESQLHQQRAFVSEFPEYIFDAATKTLTRGDGSFITDKFTTGKVTISNIGSPFQTSNNGVFTITNVAADKLTFSESVVDDDIDSGSCFDLQITVEQGGVLTVGDTAATYPSQGDRRFAQRPEFAPDEVVDAGINDSNEVVPITTIASGGAGVGIGGSLLAEDTSTGNTKLWSRIGVFAKFFQNYAKRLQWRNDVSVYKDEIPGRITTSGASTDDIVWASTIPTTNSNTTITLQARNGTSVSGVWTWVGGSLVSQIGGSGLDAVLSGSTITVTGAAFQTIGWYAILDLYGTSGGGSSSVRHDYFLDPRDFGAVWDGVTDDLAALQAMHDSIPYDQRTETVIQLPPGQGYCSDNWHISRRLDIRGCGHEEVNVIQAGQAINGIKFAPMKGLIFDGAYTSSDVTHVARADGSRLSHLSLRSTQCVVTDEGSNTGSTYALLSTTVDVWANLPATVEKGTVVLRSGATIGGGITWDYVADGATRDTTHVVMFRCTTRGTKGSTEPSGFATAGIGDLGTTISANGGGTAVWTVESVPKDYQNNHAYVVGERVLVPGDPDHVYECVIAGTSITGSANFNVYGLPLRCPWGMFQASYGDHFFDKSTLTSSGGTLPDATIDVLDTADFAASGTIQVLKTDGTYATVTYTGKTSTSFTGCTGGTGTYSGYVAQSSSGLKWKQVVGAELVTRLANTIHLDNVSLFGATGCADWVTSIADLETYPDGSGFAGGSNFWGSKDITIAFCGSGLTLNGNNVNHGNTSHSQEKFMGTGRTNVDGAAYFNISAPGKWGNGACAVKNRSLGSAIHSDHYPEFSAGVPYRNDAFGTFATPQGNFTAWNKLGNESGYNGNILPILHFQAVVEQPNLGIHPDGQAMVLDATWGRNLYTRVPLIQAPSAYLSAIWGFAFDGVASAFRLAVSTDTFQTGLNVSEDLVFFPSKWWVFGQANQAGDLYNQAWSVPRPGNGATWPGGTTLASQPNGAKCPTWFNQSRIWIGPTATADPSSLGFETGSPAAGYFVKGAVTFEQTAVVGAPIGYVCTVTGSPGTQVPLPALDDTATSTTRQTKAEWQDDAFTSPTAAKTRVGSERVTASTSATTADQVIATIQLNDDTSNVIDVVVTGKLPSSNSGATVKMSGSFTRNATLTRLGSDDLGTVKGTGSAGTPTFDLNINGTTIEVRVTPSSASQTDWTVVYQVVEGKN